MAVGASLVLHAAAGAGLAQLRPGSPAQGPQSSAADPRALHATLRSAPKNDAVAALGQTRTAMAPPTPTAKASQQPEGVAPPPAYYPIHLVDERPQVRSSVDPVFPPGAPVPSGRVVIELFIGTDGRVDELVVSDAQPPGVFELAAVQAFAAAQFTPAKVRGVPVRTKLQIEVLFGAPLPHAAVGTPQ